MKYSPSTAVQFCYIIAVLLVVVTLGGSACSPTTSPSSGEDPEVTETISTAPAKPNGVDAREIHALRRALRDGSEKRAKAILEASPHLAAELTPIDVERSLNNADLLSFIAASGARLDRPITIFASTGSQSPGSLGMTYTLMHAAAAAGAVCSAELLLESGCHVDATDDIGQTPLMISLAYGQDRMADFLLTTGGVNVNAANNRGWTALHFAASNGNHALIQALLTRGAAIKKNDAGLTPIGVAGRAIAAWRKPVDEFDRTIITLLDAGDKKDLLSAIVTRDLARTEQLLKASPNLTSEVDSTTRVPYLFTAVRFESMPIVKLLVQSGASVTVALESDGTTILHCAADPEVTKYLVQQGADFNAADRSGVTPLHVASHRGLVAVARVLLASGAQSDALDNSGRLPIDYAKDPSMHRVLLQLQTKQTN